MTPPMVGPCGIAATTDVRNVRACGHEHTHASSLGRWGGGGRVADLRALPRLGGGHLLGDGPLRSTSGLHAHALSVQVIYATWWEDFAVGATDWCCAGCSRRLDGCAVVVRPSGEHPAVYCGACHEVLDPWWRQSGPVARGRTGAPCGQTMRRSRAREARARHLVRDRAPTREPAGCAPPVPSVSRTEWLKKNGLKMRGGKVVKM